MPNVEAKEIVFNDAPALDVKTARNGLITFQFSLKGYDSHTDGTDWMVKWINAPTREALCRFIHTRQLALDDSGVDIGPFDVYEGVDLVLDEIGEVVIGDHAK